MYAPPQRQNLLTAELSATTGGSRTTAVQPRTGSQARGAQPLISLLNFQSVCPLTCSPLDPPSEGWLVALLASPLRRGASVRRLQQTLLQELH